MIRYYVFTFLEGKVSLRNRRFLSSPVYRSDLSTKKEFSIMNTKSIKMIKPANSTVQMSAPIDSNHVIYGSPVSEKQATTLTQGGMFGKVVECMARTLRW